jgi:hypothetical protein
MPVIKIKELIESTIIPMQKRSLLDRSYDNILELYDVFKNDNFHRALSYKHVKKPEYTEPHNYFSFFLKRYI